MKKKRHVFEYVEEEAVCLAEKLGVEVERFGLEHQLLYFLFVMYFTIFFCRIAVSIKDVNPVVFGFELHHFTYGVVLILLSTIYMLFIRGGRFKHFIYITLSAVSFGLIIDEFIFILGYMANEQYGATLVPSIIASIIIALVVVIVYEHGKNRR